MENNHIEEEIEYVEIEESNQEPNDFNVFEDIGSQIDLACQDLSDRLNAI